MTNCTCGKAIEQHEAGRCLDAWIGILVGYELWFVIYSDGSGGHEPFFKHLGFNPKTNNLIDKTEIWRKATKKEIKDKFWVTDGLMYELPKISTDLNEAIKLWNKDWAYLTVGGSECIFSKQALIDLIKNDKDGLGRELSKAPTLALAICRAYLIEQMKEGK